MCKEQVKLDAGTISERACVTLRFALKILRKPVAYGIVRSYKGTQGGYEINMSPRDITLKMAVESIDGTYCFSRCLAPDGVCNRNASGKCSYQRAFYKITKSVRDKMDEYTFDRLIADLEENI